MLTAANLDYKITTRQRGYYPDTGGEIGGLRTQSTVDENNTVESSQSQPKLPEEPTAELATAISRGGGAFVEPKGGHC